MGLEFGEVLRWKLPRLPDHNTLLEARWQTGVWLGRLWASPSHLVYGLLFGLGGAVLVLAAMVTIYM